jgi:hypothetical protein
MKFSQRLCRRRTAPIAIATAKNQVPSGTGPRLARQIILRGEHYQRRAYVNDGGDRGDALAGREMRVVATPGGVSPRSAGCERGLKDGEKGEADCGEHCRQTGRTIASGDEVHLTSLSLKLRNGASSRARRADRLLRCS